MYAAHENVIGKSASFFRHEFPIRFDYLDTVRGGTLSVQCHPRPAYIRAHFGGAIRLLDPDGEMP